MDDIPSPVDTNSGRLIPQIRVLMRSQNKAWATERAYVSWIARSTRFHDMRHPSTMGVREIEMFLTSLAVNTRASPATQSICEFMLVHRYSKHPVSTYIQWIRSYIRFHQQRHPWHRGAPEVVQCLTYLTTPA